MEQSYNADLHNHTTGSDGTQSPLRMLLRGILKGKEIVSISDHDSVKGYTILEEQLSKHLKNVEDYLKSDNATIEEKKQAQKSCERLLNVLETVKILPASELITSYNGATIEILGYGVNPEILGEEIKNIHENLTPGGKILTEGVDRIIKDNDLTIDRYVIDNRADFKKLFYHELAKHPENAELVNVPGESEEEKAENFSKMYLEDEKSPFYVNMSRENGRSVKEIRAAFLNMIDKNDIEFDKGIIEQSHAITGEFFNELMKHPENAKYTKGENFENLKKFLYGELYNSDSRFFIDMSPSRPSREATINAIHKAGGKAFLAHPGRYKKLFDVKEALLKGDILDGLDGVEVFYPDHDDEFRKYLLGLCDERGLYASGGSDDHLAPKDGPQYKMGTVDIPNIPETKWLGECVENGEDIVNKPGKVRNIVLKLQELSEQIEEFKNEDTEK